LISKDPVDSDLFLMRWVIWRGLVLDRPVGINFGRYEMNQIFNSLPMDIATEKMKMETPSFVDFYRAIKYAEWSLNNAD